MAATPENKVKRACVALLEKHKAYYFFPMMAGYGRAGIPDLIICHHGKFLGVECKAGHNKTTPLQERELAAIKAAGGESMVVREDTIELLEQWLIRNE